MLHETCKRVIKYRLKLCDNLKLLQMLSLHGLFVDLEPIGRANLGQWYEVKKIKKDAYREGHVFNPSFLSPRPSSPAKISEPPPINFIILVRKTLKTNQ